jgi:hypothetical protein
MALARVLDREAAQEEEVHRPVLAFRTAMAA